jgi:hypothetical protein
MQIKVTLDDGLVDAEFNRKDGNWEIEGVVDCERVSLRPTNDQVGAILFLLASGNPENTELDSLLYSLLSDAQKNSGLVP